MTCDECQDLMLEVARRRAAPFVEQSVRDHAAGCTECEELLTRQLALTAGLHALAGSVREPHVAPALEARLLAAFATRHAQPPVTRGWTDAARPWLLRAAALVLLGAGVAAWWLKTPVRVPDTPLSIARIEPPPSPVAALASPASSAARGDTESPAPHLRGSRPIRQAAPVRPADSVEPAAFTAIPAAAGLPDFESGEIVRLGIDVTALPNYGLDIPHGAQSAVQADLLIGQDGQARAIRLVNANLEDARPRR